VRCLNKEGATMKEKRQKRIEIKNKEKGTR
jgi:hypothetical protein